jgi:hypothetical protein
MGEPSRRHDDAHAIRTAPARNTQPIQSRRCIFVIVYGTVTAPCVRGSKSAEERVHTITLKTPSRFTVLSSRGPLLPTTSQ